jgi:hypothetical protein
MIQPFAPVQRKFQFLDMALKIISGLPQGSREAR